MEYVTLSNGLKIPKLGFGVFQISKEDCERCVLDALDVGYRHIDTAQSYENEAEVGSAIQKSSVPRTEIFLTTKVWISNYGYEKTKQSIMKSLKNLQTDYLDLVLLHQPYADYYGAYKALEELYQQGIIKAIGVSNFAPDRLVDIYSFNEIKPHVNQIEINPLHQQTTAHELMQKYAVQTQAWAPFGEGKNDMFNQEILKTIAQKYQKSTAQVILRWLAHKDIVALAKSVRKERMIENFNIFDFELSAEDIELITTMDNKESLFFNHQSPEAVEMFVGFVKNRNI